MEERKHKFQPAEIPENEEERLADLYSLRVLDTASELRFDRYTHLIAELFEFPIVLVSLVDRDRQWFKSSCGVDRHEIHRDESFCAHALNHQDRVFVIPDATQDFRFADNPLVSGEPYVRFYAGAVVHGPKGYPIGTLCVLDHKPRQFSNRECNWLREFGDLVENELHHIHDLSLLRASMEFSAYFDPLTHLPNRRLLIDRLQNLIDLSQRDGRNIVVLVFNIKGLRMINQSYGSNVGDRILEQLADRLRECCPAGGTAARLQADECVLVLPGPGPGENHVDTVTERIRIGLDRPFTVEGREHYLHIQVGGSVFPEHGVTPSRLIERAAAAIHAPDCEPRRGVRFVSQADSVDISHRVAVESRLRRATDKQDFQLFYQPITRLSDGRMTSLEALVRWHDDELGDVSPAQFIPIAEETGLILPIGQWVVTEACRQLAEWHRNGQCDVPVAVNVSAIELQDAAFAQGIIDKLASAGISSSLLCIEVTEFSLVSHSRHVTANMKRLHEAGVKIFIDDFGTGYSSLDYLRRMPISGLKIDRSFIDGLPGESHDKTLTRTIIAMATTLGLKTVAEGVENRDQLEFLRHAGCALVQGFLLSRPIAPSTITELPRQLFDPMVRA
ncbi:GGDEF domain-containing protein [Aquisalimonas sp.]|uniref:sensor domain-containing phosphodiesterase n=1 Tax=Aquisalimonas sp. TaxID=1872621 RepID=UPI0025BAC286|nr:GGDEF domain-containing protein [Aquisalimonas sp.]